MLGLILITDYIAVVLSLLVSMWIRHILPIGNPAGFIVPPLYLFIYIPVIFLIVLSSNNTHLRYVPTWRLSKDIFKSVSYSIVTILLLMFLGNIIEVTSRLYVLIEWGIAFSFILAFRYILRRVVNQTGIYRRKLLILGAGKTAELFLKSLHGGSSYGFEIVGFLDDAPKSDTIPNECPILGGFKDLERIVSEHHIDAITIAAPGLPEKDLKELANRAMLLTKRLVIIPNLVGLPLGNVQIENFMDERLPVLRLENNLANMWNRFLKRTFDIIATSIGLILLSPFFLIVGVMIKFTSPGPVVFAHKRLGRNGKHFPCYKFRSMVQNSQEVLEAYLYSNREAQKEWNENFKLKNDPRITKVGAFLRKTSLDELPQLWNVLVGDMSLVGPRPIIDAEVEKYGIYIDDFYMVRPGITGLWQVSGRSDTTYEERVQMDSWYVRNWSVWLDLIYLLRTVSIVLLRKGAY